MFLVSNARGCYYNRCNFCNVSLAFKSGFRQRSCSKVKEDIQSLQKMHGAQYIYFADDATSPKRCAELCNALNELSKPICWQTEVRFESDFTADLLENMYKAGCCQLAIGNESGSQRVLDLMNKGTDLRRNKQIIRMAHEAEIAIHLQNFIGFPGETVDEAKETLDFLIDLRAFVTSCSLVPYHVSEFSPVQVSPRRFGINRMRRRLISELVPHFIFDTDVGASRKQIAEVYNEALQRLKRVYPGQRYLLDGAFGAHAILFLSKFSTTKFERVFLSSLPTEELFHQYPRLDDNVEWTHLGPKSVFVYNPSNAEVTTIESTFFTLLRKAEDGLNVKGLCEHLLNHENILNDSEKINRLSFFVLKLLDLYASGFIVFFKPESVHECCEETKLLCPNQDLD